MRLGAWPESGEKVESRERPNVTKAGGRRLHNRQGALTSSPGRDSPLLPASLRERHAKQGAARAIVLECIRRISIVARRIAELREKRVRCPLRSGDWLVCRTLSSGGALALLSSKARANEPPLYNP
ncbi:hypothetical protein KM043_004176 [Ampulex compressa]|nr:hypothetical protein KM043_004176 [Ampulex compressa]